MESTDERLAKIRATSSSGDRRPAHLPVQKNGKTYGTTWIWSVVVDYALYTRAYNGTASRWYRAALQQKAGRILAAGMTKEVSFEPVDADDSIQARIDDTYRAKYSGSPYLAPMIGARARAATVKLSPHDLRAKEPRS